MLCLMVSIGLHTVVIQSAAWAGMLVSYSVQKGSVVQAVQDTFDGAHPCPLCKLAQKTTEKTPASEDGAPSPQNEGKVKLHLMAEEAALVWVAQPPARVLSRPDEQRAHALAGVPETPPPRRTALA